MDENKREGKQRCLEESQALMLSETCALTEQRLVSLCQHNKSRDTWHSEPHRDGPIGASTSRLSLFIEGTISRDECLLDYLPFSLMTRRLRSDWMSRRSPDSPGVYDPSWIPQRGWDVNLYDPAGS